VSLPAAQNRGMHFMAKSRSKLLSPGLELPLLYKALALSS
jgi:hypothetical protein